MDYKCYWTNNVDLSISFQRYPCSPDDNQNIAICGRSLKKTGDNFEPGRKVTQCHPAMIKTPQSLREAFTTTTGMGRYILMILNSPHVANMMMRSDPGTAK